jgi:hypothetical protein
MKWNKSQKITLQLGCALLMFCMLFFLLSQKEEPIQVELVPAMQEKVIAWHIGDSLVGNVADSMIIEMDEDELQDQSTAVSDSVLGSRVLLIGDSQLEGLRLPIYNFCHWNNMHLIASVVWYGSTTKEWGTSDSLDFFIKKYNPSFVILALGLNELFVNDIPKRREYINSILGKLNSFQLKHYWIGPAAWKADKGVIAVMSELNGNRFFDSSKLPLERSEDGRHPSKDAAWIWVEEVAKDMTLKGILQIDKRGEREPKCQSSPFILLNR